MEDISSIAANRYLKMHFIAINRLLKHTQNQIFAIHSASQHFTNIWETNLKKPTDLVTCVIIAKTTKYFN